MHPTSSASASKTSLDRESLDARARLELALDAGHMGVWEWRIKEERVIWSASTERIHGLEPGTFDGTLEMQRKDLHPEDRDAVLAQIQRTLAQRSSHHLTYRIIRPDGEVRWLEAHGRLVLDDRGQPESLLGVVRDITDRRDAETTRVRALASDVARAEAERGKERLEAIFDSITDSFIVIDDGQRILQANEAAAKVARIERDALVGMIATDLPQLQGANIQRAIQRGISSRSPTSAEDFLPAWDRWFESTVFPLEHGASIYTRDITVKKRAVELAARLARQTALRADVSAALSEEREERPMLERCCRALVRHLGVAFARVWTVDDAATTLLLQASAGIYTHTDGGHKAVPIGKYKIGLIASEKLPHLTNDVAHDPRVGDPAWAAREKMVAFAGYPMLVDGELVGVMAMFARQPLPEDTLSAIGSVADTVAQGLQRRRAELELEQRVAELARSNSELEQFAYVASHDLQEPLRMVASYNQLLARRYKGKLGEDADEFIGYTVEGVTRMQRLINDLLAYSRVGTRNHEPRDVDLEAVFAHVVHDLGGAIADAKAVVTHDKLPTVVGDEGQLGQLLQNLIGNAIKFHGDDPPKVHVSMQLEGATGWRFGVRDNGIGIDPQYFERIFVIFQRLHPREKYPGTGIGLAICKKIVERHGGRIWVESVPGGGSTVWFTLARRYV